MRLFLFVSFLFLSAMPVLAQDAGKSAAGAPAAPRVILIEENGGLRIMLEGKEVARCNAGVRFECTVSGDDAVIVTAVSGEPQPLPPGNDGGAP